MKNIMTSAAIVSALCIASPALAQDASPFAGPYVGVQFGLSQIETRHDDVDYWYYNARGEAHADTGAQIGIKAGYDLVSGALLAGILGEVQFGKADNYGETRPSDPSYAIGTKVTTLGSVRAKLGVTSGNLAAFATGGFAFSNAKQRYFETDGTDQYFNGKGDRSGYVLGVGALYAVSKNASIGFDISRYQFGTREQLLQHPEGFGEGNRWRLKDKVESATISYNIHF